MSKTLLNPGFQRQQHVLVYTQGRQVYKITMFLMRAIFALLFLYEGISHNALADAASHHSNESGSLSCIDSGTDNFPDPPQSGTQRDSQPREHFCHLGHAFFVAPGTPTTLAEHRVGYDLMAYSEDAPSDPNPGSLFKPPRI